MEEINSFKDWFNYRGGWACCAGLVTVPITISSQMSPSSNKSALVTRRNPLNFLLCRKYAEVAPATPSSSLRNWETM